MDSGVGQVGPQGSARSGVCLPAPGTRTVRLPASGTRSVCRSASAECPGAAQAGAAASHGQAGARVHRTVGCAGPRDAAAVGRRGAVAVRPAGHLARGRVAPAAGARRGPGARAVRTDCSCPQYSVPSPPRCDEGVPDLHRDPHWASRLLLTCGAPLRYGSPLYFSSTCQLCTRNVAEVEHKRQVDVWIEQKWQVDGARTVSTPTVGRRTRAASARRTAQCQPTAPLSVSQTNRSAPPSGSVRGPAQRQPTAPLSTAFRFSPRHCSTSVGS